MSIEFKNKTIVISGAGGALGSAVVRRFAAEGAQLALVGRDAEPIRAVIAPLNLPEENVLIGAIELTDGAAVAEFVAQAAAKFGKLDVLAAIAGGFTYSGPLVRANLADFDAMFSANLKTALYLCAEVAKQMTKTETRGRIITIGSQAALHGDADISAYAASKAALLRLTESLAAELRPNHITVNAILPGIIDTPANRKAMSNPDFAEWVTPEALADVIAFLASDAARAVSGISIPVSGGN